MESLNHLYHEIMSYGNYDGEYHDRMMHRIPPAHVINRVAYLKDICQGKVILDIGCKGPLHGELIPVTKKAYGIDRANCEYPNVFPVDLGNTGWMEMVNIAEPVDLILACEIIEHLSNAGLFLDQLKAWTCDKIFSVPNAFARFHPFNLRRGIENVNVEHVAYYSWRTFKTLLERHGYVIKDWFWCDVEDVPQGFTEGLLFLTSSSCGSKPKEG